MRNLGFRLWGLEFMIQCSGFGSLSNLHLCMALFQSGVILRDLRISTSYEGIEWVLFGTRQAQMRFESYPLVTGNL